MRCHMGWDLVSPSLLVIKAKQIMAQRLNKKSVTVSDITNPIRLVNQIAKP